MHPELRVHTGKGFTLIELAVVIAIVALMLGALLVPLATQMDLRNVSETRSQLEEVKEALYGFSMANNRIACPDCASAAAPCNTIPAANVGDGQEDRTGAPLVCVTNEGNLPWVQLGMGQSDAWANNYAYRVTPAFADDTDGTACGTATIGVSFELCSNGALTVLDSAGGNNVATNVPAVVLSRGKNGAAPATSADELENTDGDNIVVLKGFSQQVGSEFDDLVVWLSGNVLMSRMVAAGKLP